MSHTRVFLPMETHEETDGSSPEVLDVEQTGHCPHEHGKDDLTIKDVFRKHPAIIWWCLYWSLAGVSYGIDNQATGSILSVRSFRRDFGYYFDGDPVLPAKWQAAFNTSSFIGQFFGGLLCSYLTDRLGRTLALGISIGIATSGIIGQLLSTANAAFLASKLTLGFGLGFYLTLLPLAMSEYTPVVFRPIATASVQFSISVGQLLANVAIKAFGELESHWAYRGPFAVQLPFCLFLVAGLPFSPETPCYLVRRGKRDQAKASLARLYGKGSRDDIETKVCALENTLAEEGNKDASLSSIMLCFRGTNRIRTMISTFVFLGLHCTGTICIVGYSTYFFQLAGLPTRRTFDLGVCVTAVALFGVCCNWVVINRLGRRKIYVSGIFCLTALLFTIGIIDVIPSGAGKTVEAASTVAFAFIYTFTVGSCAFAILGEVSSVSLRAPTVALATGMQAFCGITFNLIIPYMMNPDQGNLKGKVGFIFGVSALCAGVWSFFFVPDLEGRSFNDIDRMFVARVPPRKMGSYKLKG